MQLQTNDISAIQPAKGLMQIPLELIVFSSLNPRTNAADDLDELKNSLGTGDTPDLAQPPTGELLEDGRVRILSGERRIRAVKEAGLWHSIEMIIQPAHALSPLQKHQHRLKENLHRRELHEFDEQAALKVSYLLANATALGATEEVSHLLEQAEKRGLSLAMALRELESFMEKLPGWKATRPKVSWDVVLDQLGIALEPSRRLQKLRVLKVAPELQERIKALPIRLSEVALRELGRLDQSDQAVLVTALEQHPQSLLLAEKVVAVVRCFLDQEAHVVTIEDAVEWVLSDHTNLSAEADVHAEQAALVTPTLSPSQMASATQKNRTRASANTGNESESITEELIGAEDETEQISLNEDTPGEGILLEVELARLEQSQLLQPASVKLIRRLPIPQALEVTRLLEMAPQYEAGLGQLAYLLSKGLTLEDALGQFATLEAPGPLITTTDQMPEQAQILTPEQTMQKGVDGLIETVEKLSLSLDLLKPYSEDGLVISLPQPYAEYTQQTLEVIITIIRAAGLEF